MNMGKANDPSSKYAYIERVRTPRRTKLIGTSTKRTTRPIGRAHKSDGSIVAGKKSDTKNFGDVVVRERQRADQN